MRFRRQDLRVESFEHVEVAPGLALLRLAGEWRAGVPAELRLIARAADGSEEEFAALPEPPGDGGGLWRAAFSAGEVLGGRDFVLERGDGPPVALPVPVAVGLPEEPEEAELDPPHPTIGALEAAERALEAERRRAERTEASLREQLRIMVNETADFMSRLEGYEVRRAELEKELSWERLLHKETRRGLAEAERARDDARERFEPVRRELERVRSDAPGAARAERELRAAQERIRELEDLVEERDGLLASARDAVERGAERAAEMERHVAELREEPAIAEDDGVVGAPPELLERLRAEADRGIDRMADLEGKLMAMRTAIEVAEASRPAAPPAGQLAQTWRRRFSRGPRVMP